MYVCIRILYITFKDSQRQNTYTEMALKTFHYIHYMKTRAMRCRTKTKKGMILAFCCCSTVYNQSSLFCSPSFSFSQLLFMYVHRDVNVLTFMMSFILRYYSCIKTGLSWEKVQLTVSEAVTFLNYEKHCLLLNVVK